jgi:hypothetical protein
MADVRTTITLEPDVYSLIQRRLETPGTSLKSVVNDAIRAGLAPRQRRVFRTKTAAMGRPTVDLDHALRLAGELDDAATLHRVELNA